MSAPFIYTPAAPTYDFGSSPYLNQFQNRQRISPHIPTVNLGDPSAPNTPIRGPRILTEDPWAPTYTRARRPSWHAGMSTPFLTTTPSLVVPADYTHTRRRSLDNRSQRPNVVDYFQGQGQQSSPYPWMVPGTPVPSSSPSYAYLGYAPVVPAELHPLLRPNSGEIRFDLSNFEFMPLDKHGRPIPFHILTQPATHPATTRMVIKSDGIPQWPVYLDYQAATAGKAYSPSSLPPITLGDVLHGIHQEMQTQITHRDWAELGEREEVAIAKAYVKRYKHSYGHEARLAADGVKRVDYFLKEVMFNGLNRKNGDQGFDHLKLMVKSK